MTATPETSQPTSRKEVWRMFDRIAPRYDRLNRLLSFGQDVVWRRKMARHLPSGDVRLLDLATGTGDQALSLMALHPSIRQAMGMDMAERMLEVGREKIARLGLADRIELRTGDATSIPLPDAQVDVVTMSFGIRNVVDVPRALGEIRRVLRPGGRALILEFSQPTSRWFRPLYLFYLRHVLPRLGSLLSGDAVAYRYLNETIEEFPHGEGFCRLLRDAGFQQVAAHPLTMGIATIYRGDRPVA